MLKKLKTLLCKVGWHYPSFVRQQERVGFHDMVSGLQVNHYICSCGRKWMFDGASTAVESIDVSKHSTPVRGTLEYKFQKAMTLVDGCYEIIEMWDAKSPAQIEWKKRWLENARELGASGE